MNTDKIAKDLANILPSHPVAPGMSNLNASALVEQEANRIKLKQDAKELARVKYIERQKLRKLQEKQQRRQSLAEELGIESIPDGQTEFQAKQLAEQQKRVEAIEAIEAQTVEPLSVTEVAKNISTKRKGAYMPLINEAIKLQGTSRPEITKLLTSLNINLSIQLTKNDTANLLACLLTCNATQLQALMNNKKVPIVIKTVIKRLIEDEKLGNIDTVERLWDRVFGKGAMQLNLPEGQQLQTGIIPNQPVSREAYLIIRDTLIK